MEKGKISLVLGAEPRQLTMPKRKNFKISLAASNDGDEIVDPRLHLAKLFVNGVESKVWSLAVGNGKREAKWSALPPGEMVTMAWSSMGESLFTHPGAYTLALHLDDIQAAPIRVDVLA